MPTVDLVSHASFVVPAEPPGVRVIPALLAHGHTVTAFVRTPSKLQPLIPASIASRITIVAGDGADPERLYAVMKEHDIESVVDCAGYISVWPQQYTQLATIGIAVCDAAERIQKESGRVLRVWLLAGIIELGVPGTSYRIRD